MERLSPYVFHRLFVVSEIQMHLFFKKGLFKLATRTSIPTARTPFVCLEGEGIMAREVDNEV